MALLNFQPPDLKRKRLKSRRIVWAIGIISMVSVAVVGFTLATPVMYFNGTLDYDGYNGVSPTYFTNDDMYTNISDASPTSFTIDWDDSGGCGGSALVDPASLSKIVVQTSSDCSQVPLGGITKEVGAEDSNVFMVSNVEGLYVGEPIASCSLGMGDTITLISGPETNTDPEYGSSFPLGSPVYFVHYTDPGLHSYDEPTEEIMHFGVNAP